MRQFSVLLPFLAGIPALAQQPGPAVTDLDLQLAAASPDYQTFLQQNAGTWWSWWCPATGTPKAIFGAGMPLDGWRENSMVEAQRHADLVLQRHRDLLGLAGSDWRLAIAARMGNAWTFTWDQYFQGLPVLQGRADVRIAGVGRVAFLGSQAFPIPAGFVTVPTIDQANAEVLAWTALGREPQAKALPGKPRLPRLVIWGDIEARALAPVHLAWEVPVSAVDADGNGPIGRYYIDARTGAVLHYRNDKHECGFGGAGHDHDHAAAAVPIGPLPPPAQYTVMGYARDGVSCLTPATNVPMPGLEINIPGQGTVVTDQNGQFTANLSAATAVTVTINGIHHQLVVGPNAVTQGATLQPGTNQTIQLLGPTASDLQLAHTTTSLWTHRVNEWCRSILGNSAELGIADQVLPTVNMAQTCNAYYTNNTINFYASGGGCANTASSSVVIHEWGHGIDDRYGTLSQTQGLSEGWGDILSEYLLDDPIIGDGFFNVVGQGIRTGLNTTQYPPPAEVHAAGEVFMGFAWKFRENLRAAFGTAQAIAISDAVVVGTLPANATDQPGALLQIFIADDNDGNLTNGVPHYNQLEPACLAHNLPYPQIQVGTVSASTLGPTGEQLKPRQVTVTAVPNMGSFTQIRLHWNDGTNHQRTMITTGNPDEYQALLPGVLAPATVSWHIEAVHSTNVIKRAPATGEFSYLVQGETRLYFEDFEHGAPGWTHGAVLGADDWEIGTPLGRSGPGWSDPSAAFSGNNCAGTDLSGNGAYENGVETWLRTPPINCSGRVGIRLRFKRWLTIDAGSRDWVQVRLGALTFWVNPTTTAQVDTGWVTQDMSMAFANNNPAAVIEFRLHSDASNTWGGWNIDDVELYTTSAPVPMLQSLTLLPEQAVQGSPVTLRVQTQGAQPFLLVLGDLPGPTQIPGLPTLQVGGSPLTLAGYTDASGAYSIGFNAPTGIGPNGSYWYSQVLTLDPTLQVVASNAFVNLFTQ